ncbi:hypothetical protein [Anabaena sp. UHCC 0253]|uniref:hypothetical protein n=1 Tax=Anabaena sp. UHCC 0253 TaxID=2590019 RepID=UPI001448198E|nr:hypothetical protein [Anabaena sp. UHCC 0253]
MFYDINVISIVNFGKTVSDRNNRSSGYINCNSFLGAKRMPTPTAKRHSTWLILSLKIDIKALVLRYSKSANSPSYRCLYALIPKIF